MAVALFVAAGACGAASDPAADTARADSAAFAALPPALAAEIDVRRILAPDALADTSRTYCQPLGDPTAEHERRRIRFRLGDTLGILFVRAERPTGRLIRVELLRRPLDGGLQRAFTWEAEGDVTWAVDWTSDEATATERGRIPRGSPAPRALRALGRQLLVIPCTGTRRPDPR